MIRSMQASDVDHLVKIARGTAFFNEREIAILDDDLQAADPGDHHYIDNSGAGFVVFGPEAIGDRLWTLHWIVVAKEAQGRGLGTSLLAFTEQQVKAQGGRLLLIETEDSPLYQPTLAFYRRRGYPVIARVPDFYGDNRDKLIFGKRL